MHAAVRQRPKGDICRQKKRKRLFALIWTCEKFHPYMYGVLFELFTDRKPLEVIKFMARNRNLALALKDGS